MGTRNFNIQRWRLGRGEKLETLYLRSQNHGHHTIDRPATEKAAIDDRVT